MRRSIIWTSPSQAAAWSGVRRSWSWHTKKNVGKQIFIFFFYFLFTPTFFKGPHTPYVQSSRQSVHSYWLLCKWHTLFMHTLTQGIHQHTSALTSSFLCKNNFTSSAFRLNMAWTRGGWRREKRVDVIILLWNMRAYSMLLIDQQLLNFKCQFWRA